MNTLALITERPLSLTIVTPDALAQKTAALELAADFRTVTTPKEQQDAIAAASICKGLVKQMEELRKERKENVLAAGRVIDGDAKVYKLELQQEQERLELLAAAFQKREDVKVAALKAAEEARQQAQRDAEAAELRREKDALAALEAKATAERLEALRAIASAQDDASREQAQRVADELAAQRAEESRNIQIACQEAAETRLEAERDRATTLRAIVPTGPAGATVKRGKDYTMMDIHAVYAARPDLVELTEKQALILAAIAIEGAPVIPGLYVFEATKVQSKV